MALISTEMARRQLRIAPDDQTFDDELEYLIPQATGIVTDYLADFFTDLGSPGWDVDTDPDTVPQFAIVQAAVLAVLANLWRHRGDENAPGPMTERVEQMLRGLHVPPLG